MLNILVLITITKLYVDFIIDMNIKQNIHNVYIVFNIQIIIKGRFLYVVRIFRTNAHKEVSKFPKARFHNYM